jgi:site-specific recombinase XerD
MLQAFCRIVGDIGIAAVEPDVVLTYLDGRGPVTTFWHRKFEALTGFYRFAIGRGYAASSPLPKLIPKRPPAFVPYIYTPEEIRRLLAAVFILECPRNHVPADAFHALLLVLYGTGLRIGEALRLTLVDVDVCTGLLAIHQSKFFKSRLVPTGPRLTEILCGYTKKRRRWPRPAGENSAFFSTWRGKALSHCWADKSFRKFCDYAGIRRSDGGRFQPRLHDMRHTFAVTRLLTWYREGADVQRLLPHLSTYLGHINIGATHRYLTMTPELLSEACRRFERYALSEAKHA